MDKLAERLRALLQGEPLRLIVYGAAVVVWLATRIVPIVAEALGTQVNLQAIDLDGALATATVAAGVLTELVRRYVYSPATVAAIVKTPPTAAGPILAAEAVGVDTSQPVAPIEAAEVGFDGTRGG